MNSHPLTAYFITCICTAFLTAATTAGGKPACPGQGDCCESNGSPGCDDADCCNAICDADPFCCNNMWDQLCANAAEDDPNCECGPPPPGPPNDLCENSITITDGDTAFSTVGAFGFGPSPCADLDNDIWFDYTATCTGTATFSTCNQADFDTVIAIYDNGCACPFNNFKVIGCNSDGQDGETDCGDTSFVSVEVIEGQCYKIQLGGVEPFFGEETGTGILTITCEEDVPMCPAQCTGDINADGQVDGADLGLLLGAFGPCPDKGLCCSDLNNDGIVDGADLGLLLGAFGDCPPDGDECEDCIPVTEGTFIADTFDNTGKIDDTSCAAGDTIDEWYCFTAECTQTVFVNTCSLKTNFDTTLAVFDSCDGSAGSELDCNDDLCGIGSQVLFAATAGETYFIRVSGLIGQIGQYELSIQCGGQTVACCFFLEETCEDIDELTCIELGGSPQFTGSNCTDHSCPDDCPGQGTCCQANGTAGCDDADCCAAVCNIDPVCCSIDWDFDCGQLAQTMSEVCECAFDTVACCFPDGSCQDIPEIDCLAIGGDSQNPNSTCKFDGCPTDACPGPEDCCMPSIFDGCNDEDCCLLICTLDNFCCEFNWDQNCADAALAMPEICDCADITLANDNCENATEVGLGDTEFTTITATTDGSPDPACSAGDGSNIQSDVWFTYTAEFTGNLTVSTCEGADFDTKLAVYEGCACPATEILGCNDDSCFDFTSEVTISVTRGTCYTIRVGGWGGQEGSGTLTLSK